MNPLYPFTTSTTWESLYYSSDSGTFQLSDSTWSSITASVPTYNWVVGAASKSYTLGLTGLTNLNNPYFYISLGTIGPKPTANFCTGSYSFCRFYNT